MTARENRRKHRTADEMIADLQAEIDPLKARVAAKKAKSSFEAKAVLAAAKAIDKALQAATSEELGRALEAARAPLSAQMVQMGLRAPVPRNRRRR